MTSDLAVAVAQLDTAPRTHDQALAVLEREIGRAGGADLLVLPELALCGYGDRARVRALATPLDSPFVAEVRALARRNRMGLVAGHAEREGDTLFNAALAIGPDGVLHACYRKVHLWGDYEKRLFTPGLPGGVIPMGPLRLGLLICYDLEFPEAARDLALKGADTLVVISATSVPYQVVPHCLVPARGYETGCHIVFANWSGNEDGLSFLGSSRICGPDGSVLAEAATGAASVGARLDLETVVRWREAHDYLADRRRGLYGRG
jgi:5-aminopentanamidase